MRDEIWELRSCHATTMAKIAEYRRNLVDLSHRVLKVHFYHITSLCKHFIGCMEEYTRSYTPFMFIFRIMVHTSFV